MRALILLCTLVFPCIFFAQTTASGPAQTQSDLAQALASDWAGFLEYRDYSEPPTSTKRVQLPTWLSIAPTSAGQSWHYIYDDGPNKTAEETDLVAFHPADSAYSESDKWEADTKLPGHRLRGSPQRPRSTHPLRHRHGQ